MLAISQKHLSEINSQLNKSKFQQKKVNLRKIKKISSLSILPRLRIYEGHEVPEVFWLSWEWSNVNWNVVLHYGKFDFSNLFSFGSDPPAFNIGPELLNVVRILSPWKALEKKFYSSFYCEQWTEHASWFLEIHDAFGSM